MLKVVYAGNHYYNHDPKLGSSFEHQNFYGPLSQMKGIDLTYIPFDETLRIGVRGLNELILKTVKEKKPDIFLVIMPHEDLEKEILTKIKNMTTSVGWFGDDTWSFHTKTVHWAPYFTWCITTYAKIIPEYEKRGVAAIGTQLGANHQFFYPTPEALIGKPRYNHDVSFIGAWYHNRGRIVEAIRSAGINLETWGPGWPEGRLSDEAMLHIMKNSKISIDINPSPTYFGIKPFVGLFIKRKEGGGFRWVGNQAIPNLKAWKSRHIPLVKPRTFNGLAARGFTITQMTHDLGDYYETDKEIVAFRTTDELIEKIKYYLTHDAERETIAQAGYERTTRDHTWEKRFTDIFRQMGFRYP